MQEKFLLANYDNCTWFCSKFIQVSASDKLSEQSSVGHSYCANTTKMQFLGETQAFHAIGIGFPTVLRSFDRHEISSSDISITVSPRITKFYMDNHTGP